MMRHTKTKKKKTDRFIRWLIRRDMPEVMQIESESFEFPWLEKDFVRHLRQRNCIGVVVEHDDQVVGFMIYELHKTRICVLDFVVAPTHRRNGVGRMMTDKLKAKLSPLRRRIIEMNVGELNLPAQLFFRTQGFRVRKIIQNYYEHTAEDAYQFVYEIPSAFVDPL